MKHVFRSAAALLLSLGCTKAAAQCNDWEASFGTTVGASGLGMVLAGTTWDPDGSGSLERRLVIAASVGDSYLGGFHNYVAWWNGVRWTRLGNEMDGEVVALSTWDPDGPGPATEQLVCGGSFTTIGGQSMNRVARWDGAAWQPFGVGLGRNSERVLALQAWDPDGLGSAAPVLVAGGEFTTAGSSPNFAAWWDGSVWKAFTGEFNNTVRALTIWDPDGPGPLNSDLVAAGSFTTAGGVPRNRIAHWNGSLWNPFANGFGGLSVEAVTVWDPDGNGPAIPTVIAGGTVGSANVSIWNGHAWEFVGSGTNGGVTALTTWDADGPGPEANRLVVAGSFSLVGGLPYSRSATWNGAVWQPMGNGAGIPNDLVSWPADGSSAPPKLVATGTGEFGGPTSNGIVAWNGNSWQIFGQGIARERIAAFAMWDSDGAGPLESQLVAAGRFYFTSVDREDIRRIARWDGAAWRPFGSGIGPNENNGESVYSAVSWDPDGPGPLSARLVVAGFFPAAGGTTANKIAQWDGQSWQPLGSGMDMVVDSLAVWDPDDTGPQMPVIVAGGRFVTAGGLTVNGIAKWDGTAWSSMDTGVGGSNPRVWAVLVWDPDGDGPLPSELVIGGGFTSASGQPAARMARWSGSQWQPIGSGLSGGPFGPQVYCLTSWDPDGEGPLTPRLVAGGFFNASGPFGTMNHIAYWDGAAWKPLGAGMSDYVNAILSWDPDGSGPLPPGLIAGGRFNSAEGVLVNHVARWNGLAWMGLNSGVYSSSEVEDLLPWDPDGSGPARERFIAGGNFITAGTTPAAYIASWIECSTACYANCDGVGGLTGNDFQCFLNAYVAGQNYANCDGVGGLTGNDFQCFLNKYVAGCP